MTRAGFEYILDKQHGRAAAASYPRIGRALGVAPISFGTVVQ